MFLAIFCDRSSSASEIFGNAYFLSTSIVIPNASSVQIISPSPGWTRKLPPLLLGAPASEDERR